MSQEIDNAFEKSGYTKIDFSNNRNDNDDIDVPDNGNKDNNDNANKDIQVNPLEIINKTLGSQFKDEEEFKGVYSKLSEYEKSLNEYKTREETEWKKLKEDNDNYVKTLSELEATVDPMTFFANESEYKRQQLLKEFPDYDTNLISDIISGRIKEYNDIDVLVADEIRKNKSLAGKKDILTKSILKEHNVLSDAKLEAIRENEGEDAYNEAKEQNEINLLTIQRKAGQVRSELESIPAKYQAPEKVTLEALRNKSIEQKNAFKSAIKNNWSEYITKQLVTDLKQYDVADGTETLLSINLDDNYLAEISKQAETTLEHISSRGLEFNEQNKKAVIDDLKSFYINQNLPSILKSYKDQILAATTEQMLREFHNSNALKKDKIKSDNDANDGSIESQMRAKYGW